MALGLQPLDIPSLLHKLEEEEPEPKLNPSKKARPNKLAKSRKLEIG